MCKGFEDHLVQPGFIYCWRCAERVHKHDDKKHHEKEMQKIYKEFVKQRHTHWFIAGICYKCHLARENLHNPWKVFLKRYGTGSYGESLRRTKWNRYS
jgi:hypothetical protein